MKFAATLLSLAGIASAIVIPEASVFATEQPLPHQHAAASPIELSIEHATDKVTVWWEDLLDHIPTRESLLYAAGETIDSISQGVQNGKATLELLLNEELQALSSEVEKDSDDDDDDDADWPGHHPDTSDETIYELVQKSKYTTKFAKLIEDFPEVVKLLNSTDVGKLTLFVPTDEAFERLPHHGDDDKKPPKEVIEATLLYHIGLGFYPAQRILKTHTIPTFHKESWLGNHPQRLRTRVGLGGVRVNFFSKVVAANILASNGIIHGVDHLILPPPLVGRIISLLPQCFSTLLLAYEKTDFVKFIHSVPQAGSTVFAPSNSAFARLGYKANAFLFNTDKGLKYLKAILKYHIIVNQTLYSDAFYEQERREDDDAVAGGGGSKQYHIDLPTLLDEKSVSVDISRWGGWYNVKVNGFVPVTVQDLVSRNGVIQVVGRVLVPPHKHGKPGGDSVVDGEIEVEELVERLKGYVEDDDASNDGMGDL